MSEQQVFVIPGGTVVHLTTTCNYMKRARGRYEQKTLLQVKAAAKGEPRMCGLCQAVVRKAVTR